MTIFYASITDEITGAVLNEELECEIETSIAYGEVCVDDITVDGKSLYRGTPMSAAIANQIEAQALADDDFVAEALRSHDMPIWDTPAQQREHGTVF